MKLLTNLQMKWVIQIKQKLDFFIKSNTILQRHSSFDDIIIAHIDALKKAIGCEVTVVVDKQIYGKAMTPIKLQGDKMTKFSVPNGQGIHINEGAVIFWSDKIDNFAMIAASQVDVVVTNYFLHQKLHQQSITDGLTKLYNRRYFMELFVKELTKTGRLGFIIFDIDHFKTYNDEFGHPAGDELLQQLSSLVLRVTRKTDIIGRLGGEEFGVLTKDVSKEGLITVAEKIRTSIESTLIPPTSKRPVTVSIGGSLYPFDGEDLDTLYLCVDQRLYQAKEQGRNRVVMTTPHG